MPQAMPRPDESSRVPGEFRYWDHLETPWVRIVRRLGQRVLGYDLAPPREVVETIARMYYDADPIAEDFVDEVYLGRGAEYGHAMLGRALEEGVMAMGDAPRSLRALFADIERDPEWVDWHRVELGARVFRRWGTAVFRFAGALTLAAYTENSVAKPLVLTGAYSGANTRHRFLETAAFWIAVSEPGGLRPGASGRASALRVRIMHVFVRRRLSAHPEWDEAAWGVPISQADALLTLMGGSVAPAFGLRVLGFFTSEAELDALMHFWRYVGHLMGVRPRWYPANAREAYQLGFVAAVKSAHRAGDDGVELCRAYEAAFSGDGHGAPPATLSERWEDGLHRAYTRLFLPPLMHRRFGLRGAGAWPVVLLASAPWRAGLELVRRMSPTVDDRLDRAVRRQTQRWFSRASGGRRPEYRAVERFTR